MSFNRKQTARHEAGHAAAMILRGRLPRSLSASHAEAGVYGRMDVAWDSEGELDPEAVFDLVVAIHAGPIHAGNSDWPPRWPPSIGAPGDEGQLAACARFLNMDRSDWDAAYVEAAALVGNPEFTRIAGLIARALELSDEIDADGLRRLIGTDRLELFGIPPADHTDKETTP